MTAPLPWLPARVSGGDAGSPITLPRRLLVPLPAAVAPRGKRGGSASPAVLLAAMLPSAPSLMSEALGMLTCGMIGGRPSEALQQGMRLSSCEWEVMAVRRPALTGYLQASTLALRHMLTGPHRDHRRQRV